MSAGVYPVMPRRTSATNGGTYFTVTGASQVCLAANPNRQWAVLTNSSSADTIYLALGKAAVVGSGIVLPPGVGYTFDHTNPWTSSIYAISSGSSTNLAIVEV
jgi:hypothetical protein